MNNKLLVFAGLFLTIVTANTDLKPTLKWFIFREDCFDKFLVKQDFTDMECIKFTISKGIGLAIILGSSILKLPQILKIVSNKSVEGIVHISCVLEVSSELILSILLRL